MSSPKGFPGIPDHWSSIFETFPSSDRAIQLSWMMHSVKKDPSFKVLLVVHGLGEHAGRYLHFPHYLQTTVGSVCCLDHRGHGRSEGPRGHVDSFDQYTSDVALAIQRLDEIFQVQFGRSEIHLLGHSLGGLIALRTLHLWPDLPVFSATFSAPLLGVKLPVPWVKKTLGQILSKFWGSFQMSSELDAALLSHDPNVTKAYRSDYWVHQKITPRFFTEMTAAMADTLSRSSGLKVPAQFLVPMQDQIVDSEMTIQYFEKLQLKDKRLKTYPEFFHEPFNEVGKDQVFEDLKQWIQIHTMKS